MLFKIFSESKVVVSDNFGGSCDQKQNNNFIIKKGSGNSSSNHDNYLVRDIFIFILDVPSLGLNI